MKHIIIAGMILLLSVAVGCGKFSYMAPEIPETVCSDYDKSTSHILKVADKYNIELNELYYGLLDSATIALVTDVVDRVAVKNFIENLEEFILFNAHLTYTDVVLKMVSDSDKALLLKSLLHRRIVMSMKEQVARASGKRNSQRAQSVS